MYKLLICIIKPDVPKISENTLPLKIGLNLYTLNFNKHSENMYSGKDTCYTTNVFTDFIGTCLWATTDLARNHSLTWSHIFLLTQMLLSGEPTNDMEEWSCLYNIYLKLSSFFSLFLSFFFSSFSLFVNIMISNKKMMPMDKSVSPLHSFIWWTITYKFVHWRTCSTHSRKDLCSRCRTATQTTERSTPKNDQHQILWQEYNVIYIYREFHFQSIHSFSCPCGQYGIHLQGVILVAGLQQRARASLSPLLVLLCDSKRKKYMEGNAPEECHIPE